MTDEAAAGFLARWARRKEQGKAHAVRPADWPTVRQPTPGTVAAAPAVEVGVEVEVAVPLPDESAADSVAARPATEPLPTLADVARLDHESDFSRFVTPGVDEGVKQAAMKKLFSDPHFNVMDGLDTYIDDYGKPDPIPLAMLRQMTQSKVLRLFEDDDKDDPATPPTTEPSPPTDDDADLRLQQDDAAGRPGPDQGARA